MPLFLILGQGSLFSQQLPTFHFSYISTINRLASRLSAEPLRRVPCRYFGSVITCRKDCVSRLNTRRSKAVPGMVDSPCQNPSGAFRHATLTGDSNIGGEAEMWNSATVRWVQKVLISVPEQYQKCFWTDDVGTVGIGIEADSRE